MRKVLTGWVTAILAVSFVATCPAEETDTVRLVMPDGSYPTRPLEKDVIVLKVVQNGVKNLQEFPVLQTEYGNIAVSTVQLDPFVYAAFAMRGVEIMDAKSRWLN